ncbi:MAG: hypothetical protein Q7S87_16205, partial [Agitococcus sp.]|nr:hypothetical protein [Agitococcus sp.]
GTAVTVFAGEIGTISEVLSNSANYTATLACTGNGTALAGNSLTINPADTAITCTQTNTRKSAQLTLVKTWADARNGETATVTTSSFTNNASTGLSTSTGNNTTTGTAVTVYAGEVGTISEVLSNSTNYTATLACTGNTTALVGNSLTIDPADTAITCTQTNTRKSAHFTLVKTCADARNGETATVTTSSFTNNASTGLSTSTGNNTTTGTAVTVFAGEIGTISEVLSNSANYTATLACTGNGTALAGNSLTINPADTAITCTQTNTRKSAQLTLVKTWAANSIAGNTTTVSSSGFSNSASSGLSTATVLGNTTTGTAITVYAGESGTISETFGVGSASNYDAVLSCTGNATALVGSTLTVDPADTAITCTETNTRKGATLTLVKTWAANSIAGNTTTVTNSGFINNASSGLSTATALGNTTTGTAITVYAGESGTISETFGVGSAANYNAVLSCTGNTTALTGNTLTVDPADTAITCTETNTRKTATLTLVKTWAVNSIAGNTTTVTNTGFINSGSSGLSTATALGNTTTGTAITVYAGESGTITETFGVGSAANYDAVLSCTGNTTALGGNTLTVDPADTAIICTETNTRKTATLTLRKTWAANSIAGNTVTVTTSGFINSASSGLSTATTIGNTTTGSSVTVYAGESGTLSETFGIGSAANYSAALSCTGNASALVGNALTVNAADSAIVCTYTNTKTSGNTIQGKVFFDNGKGIATPHNGLQETGELGIGNITMTLTDCASTTYQTVLTDGAGAYSFTIPNSLITGTTLCVEEHQPSTLVSVTGVVGTTSGTYSLASDRTQFSLTINTNYTGVNFGDVAESQLTGTGSQTISAGTTANYIHQFIAGTEGSVTLTTAQAPSPSLSGWTSIMYLDATCDAQLNAGDTQITAPFSVIADQVVCLIQKVQSPVTATNGAMDISTVSASFAFAAPSSIVRPYSQTDTTIIMDSSLVLVKRLRQVGSCPSTGADVNPFITNNQALPNTYIEYQIQYSNPSAATLSNITVHDVTPAFTEFRSASCTTTPSSLLCATPSVGSGTAPSVGGAGDIDWILTNNPSGLGAGQSGEVRFCVRISP